MHDKEKLRGLVLEEGSKKQVNRILRWLRAEPQRVQWLVELVLENEKKTAERASWPLGYLGSARKVDIVPYLPQLVDHLSTPGLHNGVKRNITRMLMYARIPEELHGEVMDICFRMLEDPQEFIAVRANCISILDKLSRQYPEIIPEVLLVIEARMPTLSGGLAARVRRFRKRAGQSGDIDPGTF